MPAVYVEEHVMEETILIGMTWEEYEAFLHDTIWQAVESWEDAENPNLPAPEEGWC